MEKMKCETGVIYLQEKAVSEILHKIEYSIALNSDLEPFPFEEQLNKQFSGPVAATWVANQLGKEYISEMVNGYPSSFSIRLKGSLFTLEGYPEVTCRLWEVKEKFWSLQPRGSEHTKERVALREAQRLANMDRCTQLDQSLYKG